MDAINFGVFFYKYLINIVAPSAYVVTYHKTYKTSTSNIRTHPFYSTSFGKKKKKN